MSSRNISPELKHITAPDCEISGTSLTHNDQWTGFFCTTLYHRTRDYAISRNEKLNHPRTRRCTSTPQRPRECLRHGLLYLTFDLQNLIRSSVGASECPLSVLSKLFESFMRYGVHKIWTRQPAVTLTFSLWPPESNRSSVRANEYSL